MPLKTSRRCSEKARNKMDTSAERNHSKTCVFEFRNFLRKMLIRLPLPQCFSPRGRKLRPWSEKNSDQNPDHPRLCNYQGKEKLRPWSEFLGRENSDHVFGVGVDEGALTCGKCSGLVSKMLGPCFAGPKQIPGKYPTLTCQQKAKKISATSFCTEDKELKEKCFRGI